MKEKLLREKPNFNPPSQKKQMNAIEKDMLYFRDKLTKLMNEAKESKVEMFIMKDGNGLGIYFRNRVKECCRVKENVEKVRSVYDE